MMQEANLELSDRLSSGSHGSHHHRHERDAAIQPTKAKSDSSLSAISSKSIRRLSGKLGWFLLASFIPSIPKATLGKIYISYLHFFISQTLDRHAHIISYISHLVLFTGLVSMGGRGRILLHPDYLHVFNLRRLVSLHTVGFAHVNATRQLNYFGVSFRASWFPRFP